LQLKLFKVGSKMAIAASAPVLPNQKKTVLQIRPIHWRTLHKRRTNKKEPHTKNIAYKMFII
jgi:hypothetical protein